MSMILKNDEFNGRVIFNAVKLPSRVTKSFGGKNCPIFPKVAQKVSELKKCQNIYPKAQIESPNIKPLLKP
jgi:hypothetical protein